MQIDLMRVLLKIFFTAARPVFELAFLVVLVLVTGCLAPDAGTEEQSSRDAIERDSRTNDDVVPPDEVPSVGNLVGDRSAPAVSVDSDVPPISTIDLIGPMPASIIDSAVIPVAQQIEEIVESKTPATPVASSDDVTQPVEKVVAAKVTEIKEDLAQLPKYEISAEDISLIEDSGLFTQEQLALLNEFKN